MSKRDLQKGDRVRSKMMGEGTVKELRPMAAYNRKMAVVTFDSDPDQFIFYDLDGKFSHGEDTDYDLEIINPPEHKDPAGADHTNPDYYKSGGIECIEAIKASMSTEEFHGFLKGNVQKYVWRFEKKNGLEDLKKAGWYLNRLISETLDGGSGK